MFQSRYCLSDVDVRLSQAHVLFSEINQMMSKCPEPVQSRKLLPRLDVILSEISSLVALSQDCINDVDGDDSYDCPDGSLSLDRDDYNYNSINYYDLQNYDDLNNNLSLSASGQSYAEDCFHDEDEDAGGNDIHGDTGGRDPKCGGRSAREWARPLFSKFTYKLVSFMWAKGLQSGRSQLKTM